MTIVPPITGAATAMFAAVEINNSLLRIRHKLLRQQDEALSTTPGYSKWMDALKKKEYSQRCSWLDECETANRAPYISCVAFGMPPCVSKVLPSFILLHYMTNSLYYFSSIPIRILRQLC